MDFYRSLYTQDNLSNANALSNITHINKYSLGSYIEEEYFLLNNFSALGGFRYEAVEYDFNYHDNSTFFPNPDVDTKTTPNKKAYNFGLNYKYWDDSNIFFNINQSFRFPAVDEFFTGTLNTALKPQVSHDLEAGIRHNFGKRLHFELSGYRMNIKDELFTDPTASGGLGATTNYDRTIHQGIDINSNLKVLDNLSLYGGYSFQNSEFDKGQFKGEEIPWVPEQKANLGLRFKFLNDYNLNLGEYYVGSRYRINDVRNDFPKVKGYFTTDLGLSYNHKGLTITGNINNLFNEYYYEFATYGAFSGNKLYYPAPGRNFSLKFDYAF
jgi:iron complex outermembrane receptor protein